MNIFKKLLYILSWIPLGILNFALLLVGIPIVALFAGLDQTEWPRWTWLWQNEEDAGEPWWYIKRFPDGSPWLRIRLGENMGGFDPNYLIVFARHNKWVRQWKYSAFRNPVNNHRFLITEPAEYNSVGHPGAFEAEPQTLLLGKRRSCSGWRWSGFFAGYKRTWLKGPGKYSEIYFGWKVGSEVPGLGFTVQLRFNRDYVAYL